MPTRRAFVGGLGLAGASMLFPSRVLAALPERRLSFRNVHTNEVADACYFSKGAWRADGLAELDHFMRDWRNGQGRTMDRGLFDLLVAVRDRLDAGTRRFDLISGYRSPATNAALHERSSAVASKSQHLLGKAADVHLPGVDLSRLRDAGLAVQTGGVGYYPADGFVHLDTGKVRHW